jgi:hypothetical protein
MNTHLQRPATGGPKTGFAGWFGLASLMLTLCCGTGLLLLPAGIETSKGDRVPAGQLSADMRSLVAALRYLLEPDLDDEVYRLATYQPRIFAVQTTLQPSATLGCSSNQMQMAEPFTNRPARS